MGALDLRHPDLEMAIPARAALLARGGMFGVPAPGADRLLALPVRHGDAEPVRPRVDSTPRNPGCSRASSTMRPAAAT